MERSARWFINLRYINLLSFIISTSVLKLSMMAFWLKYSGLQLFVMINICSSFRGFVLFWPIRCPAVISNRKMIEPCIVNDRGMWKTRKTECSQCKQRKTWRQLWNRNLTASRQGGGVCRWVHLIITFADLHHLIWGLTSWRGRQDDLSIYDILIFSHS
jgi:hypothetical protein